MSAETIIELTNVDVSHIDTSNAVVIRDVNWRIARNEFWVVGGDPASGKSSLLTTAAGLNRPCAGTLRIFGRDLAEASERDQVGWRRRIGFVFENGGRLFSRLTVAENIALPLQYHQDCDDATAWQTVAERLKEFGLESHAQTLPSRLSLRLQQRASVARSLAGETEVLFLDNPLGPLALREAHWWVDCLRRLHQTGRRGGAPMTLVASCDDFRGWIDLADKFAIIDDERFKVIGGREELLADQEPAVRELLANTN